MHLQETGQRRQGREYRIASGVIGVMRLELNSDEFFCGKDEDRERRFEVENDKRWTLCKYIGLCQRLDMQRRGRGAAQALFSSE